MQKKSLFHFLTSLNIFLRNFGRNQPSTTLCTIASWAQSHQLPPCLESPRRAEGPVLAAPSLVSAGHRVATQGLETYPPNNARWGPCKGQPRAVRPLAVSLPGPWWAQPSPCAPPDKEGIPTTCSILLWSMCRHEPSLNANIATETAASLPEVVWDLCKVLANFQHGQKRWKLRKETFSAEESGKSVHTQLWSSRFTRLSTIPLSDTAERLC